METATSKLENKHGEYFAREKIFTKSVPYYAHFLALDLQNQVAQKPLICR